jgi:hypothetical protein
MKREMFVRPPRSAAAENAAISGGPAWTFLTNHAHVLLCIYRDSGIRLREVAQRVGITERMVQKIVAELAEAGYLAVEKEGRCNRYEVQRDFCLRHPLESQHTVGRLLDVLSRDA